MYSCAVGIAKHVWTVVFDERTALGEAYAAGTGAVASWRGGHAHDA